MSPKRLLLASLTAAAGGALALGFGIVSDSSSWETTDKLALILLFGALYLVGVALVVSLRSVLQTQKRAEARAERQSEMQKVLRDTQSGTVAAIEGISQLTHDIDRLRRELDRLRRYSDMIRKDMDMIIDELVHGPISHVPGQVARMEAALPADGGTSQPALRTDASPTTDTVFDQIYVLNMAADAAKLAHLSEMFGRHRVSFVRFDAIDGNNSEFDAEWAEYDGEGPVLLAEKKMNRRLIESRGAWGYIKTMQAVLEDARSSDHQRILIFDDDVMLHRDFQNRFAIVWAELPEDWKLVYLGSAQADPSKLSNYSDHLNHPGGMANGSYAIAMDSSVIDQALTATGRFDWPFDSGALREIDVAYPSKVFAVAPPLVITEVSVSSIRKSRDMDAHVAKHGWNLADYEPSHTLKSLDQVSQKESS